MEHTRQPPNGKPFDIRERLFLFACDVVNTSQKLHSRGPISGSLSLQLVHAAVSAAANAEEADDPSSGRDFRAKDRIMKKILATIIRNNAQNESGGEKTRASRRTAD
jgi:hypothetical protein